MNKKTKTQPRKYKIICRYNELKIKRTNLPLFLSFRPNNEVKLVVTIAPDNLTTLLETVKKWFIGFRVISITEEV